MKCEVRRAGGYHGLLCGSASHYSSPVAQLSRRRPERGVCAVKLGRSGAVD